MECGVPEGSVLEPLFFLVYVNNMVRVSTNLGIVLLADDTNLFAEGKDSAELYGWVNAGLGELNRCFGYNMLTLNTKKTRVRVFLRAKRAGGAAGGPHNRGREGGIGGGGPVSWGPGL